MSAQADSPEPDYVEETIRLIERAKAAQGPGRPIAFTRRTLTRLFAALERGNFRESACAYAGIPYRTFRAWVEAGTDDETESTPQWFFTQAVNLAEALWTDAMVGVVSDAAKANPRFYMAAIIALSRRQRQHWAERTAEELRAAQTPTVQVLIGIAPPGTPANPLSVSVRQLSEGAKEEFRPSTFAMNRGEGLAVTD